MNSPEKNMKATGRLTRMKFVVTSEERRILWHRAVDGGVSVSTLVRRALGLPARPSSRVCAPRAT